MLHLLQSFAHMDTTRLDHQLRDIVFSCSFNYGASGTSNPSTGIDDEKSQEFGDWEG